MFDWQNFGVSSIKFDYRTRIEVNRTIGVRLDSITNRSIGYAGLIPRTIPGGHGSEDLKKEREKNNKNTTWHK